jgi:hypothetical protein
MLMAISGKGEAKSVAKAKPADKETKRPGLKPLYNGSSSLPLRSRFGVAMSPSSTSSSSIGGGGGFFDLSSPCFGGSLLLPIPLILVLFAAPAGVLLETLKLRSLENAMHSVRMT